MAGFLNCTVAQLQMAPVKRELEAGLQTIHHRWSTPPSLCTYQNLYHGQMVKAAGRARPGQVKRHQNGRECAISVAGRNNNSFCFCDFVIGRAHRNRPSPSAGDLFMKIVIVTPYELNGYRRWIFSKLSLEDMRLTHLIFVRGLKESSRLETPLRKLILSSNHIKKS